MGKRNPNRISEVELVIPTLRILASQQSGYISTSRLIRELSVVFSPRGEDAEILRGRLDTRFSQIVRNMKSHQKSPNNIIGQGFAKPLSRGFAITDAGREYLRRKGG